MNSSPERNADAGTNADARTNADVVEAQPGVSVPSGTPPADAADPSAGNPPESESVAGAAGQAEGDEPIHGIADGVLRHLDPRAVTLEQLRGLISSGVVSFALLFPAVIAAVESRSVRTAALWAFAWLAISALNAWRALSWPAVAHRHQAYKLDPNGIEIRRGVFWRTVINVPRSRVQHTDVAQGPLERRFGLGQLVVYTAGSDYARVSLGGLEHQAAMKMRDYLLPGGGGDAL